jgi:glycosyltransferase involved in cell wall biosynthesis
VNLTAARHESTSPTRSFRVAFCLDALRPLQDVVESGTAVDGAYILQADIAASLRTRGHAVTFIARRDLADVEWTRDLQALTRAPRSWTESHWFELASRTAWRAQQWLRLPYLNVFSNWRLFDACVGLLPGHDLVYERNSLYSAGVAKACRHLALPYVVFFDADQILEQDFIGQPITGLLRWRATRLLRFNLSTADAVICVSQASRDHLVGAWGVHADRVVVFSNGVDIERFRPDPVARAAVRASLDLSGNPVVGFVGSFFDWHDLGTLLDAFARVLTRLPDARLVLVGDGRNRGPLAERAASLGIEHAVWFTGAVPHADVNRLLSGFDVAVAPYPVTTRPLWFSPMKVFEYMAAGKAIVASEAGQLAEVIEDGRNGLLVETANVDALATALHRLILDAGLRDRLGREARRDAEIRHSWEQYGLRLERLFADVVAAHQTRLSRRRPSDVRR